MEDWIVGDDVDLGKIGWCIILNGIFVVGFRFNESVFEKGVVGFVKVNELVGDDDVFFDFLLEFFEKLVKDECESNVGFEVRGKEELVKGVIGGFF